MPETIQAFGLGLFIFRTVIPTKRVLVDAFCKAGSHFYRNLTHRFVDNGKGLRNPVEVEVSLGSFVDRAST